MVWWLISSSLLYNPQYTQVRWGIFLLWTKLQVSASAEACQVSPLTWLIAGLRFKIDCHAGFYKIFGIYSQKSVLKCIFNQIALSNLPIYSFVDDILNLVCKISLFHFSYSCANSMEQRYQHPPWQSSCMPHTPVICKWLRSFWKEKHSYKWYHF